MVKTHCQQCGRLNPAESHFCSICQLYHYQDDCTDPYFNDPDVWCDC